VTCNLDKAEFLEHEAEELPEDHCRKCTGSMRYRPANHFPDSKLRLEIAMVTETQFDLVFFVPNNLSLEGWSMG
jgi:hypothetical protein